MLFSSMTFLWLFLPFVFFGYRLLNYKYRNAFLLLTSLLFYAWGEPKYIILMLLSIVINYCFGMLIEKKEKHKRLTMVMCVIFNIIILGYFKYYNLIVKSVNALLGVKLIETKYIALPVGISFYTFQILSYVIDVYRNETPAQTNLLQLALYISFFPQLIAGPIVKYHDINEQINNRVVTAYDTTLGIRRFIIGLGKKVLIANCMAKVVDHIFVIPGNELSTILAWTGAVCYTLQIYYDFSGYSDMAIGLGKMFGFKFRENFNYPYISVSIQDFWRKWHISLSSWFKEYLYIPLGGSKKGKTRTYINLVIVFFCTGLWHGANYTFIIWGLYHGIFMLLERAFLGELLLRNRYRMVNRLYVVVVVCIGWVLFRCETIGEALDYIATMFSIKQPGIWNVLEVVNVQSIAMLLMGILGCGIIQRFKIFKYGICNIILREFAQTVLLFFLAFCCIISLVSGVYNPFIYFRF